MNKRPVYYMQTDKRWKNTLYCNNASNGATIGTSGCGPTSAAMVIATLKDQNVTPVNTCAWSVRHGYRYDNQGTAYSYFVPQLAEYGIECKQLLSSRILNKPNHEIHDKVKDYLAQGYWIIALMGTKADGSRGLWTSSGHLLLVWDWDDKVRINDPIHSGSKYLNGDPYTFRNEVRMYWLVDARKYNQAETEDEDMTGEEIYKKLVEYMATMKLPEWAEEELQEAKDAGITDGTNPMQFTPRYQTAIMVKRGTQK